MTNTKVEVSGESTQITVRLFTQITVENDEVTIDLINPSLCIEQVGGRLTIKLNPRLAYVAPEERGNVAKDLGLEPYAYSRIEGEV